MAGAPSALQLPTLFPPGVGHPAQVDQRDLSHRGDNYAGKLRSNFLGTEFVAYDDADKPHAGAAGAGQGWDGAVRGRAAAGAERWWPGEAGRGRLGGHECSARPNHSVWRWVD